MTVSTPKPTRQNRLALILTILIFFAAGLFLGRYIIPINSPIANTPLSFVTVEEGQRQIIFPTYWEAWDILHDSFIGDLDDKDLFYGAVAGMVRAANDPYTVFSKPDATKQFEETLSGEFSGVGIEIGVRNHLVRVIAPLAGSPAEAAGVLAGDTIVAIDGEPITQESTLDEVVQQIRGPKNTEVKLTVVHEDASETSEVTIARDTIDVASVELKLEDQIAHISISNFNADTADDFSIIARQALKDGAKGVILDVRNNPGGFLQAAVDISSEFLPRNTLVVSERSKEGDVREHNTSGRPTFGEFPVVVLINGGSASASEIVAGALQDQRKILTIGDKSFGKGSVQDLRKLKDGSSVRVTIAKWFTPGGRSIDDEGIQPVIEIANDPETEEDEQLEEAKKQLAT